MKRIVIGLVLLILGVAIALDNFNIIDINFRWVVDLINCIEWRKLILPAILIIIGLNFILHRKATRGKNGNFENVDTSANACRMSAMLCGKKAIYTGKPFAGAKISTLMGAVALDLRGAQIEKDVIIDVDVCMGGAEIIIPQDMVAEMDSSTLMGGVKNTTNSSCAPDAHRIIIKANCLMGGIEVKN